MSQLEDKQEIQDPAEALLFIRGVLSASREGNAAEGVIGSILAAALTIAAGVGTWWMSKNGLPFITLMWAVHNLAILSIMVIKTKRAKSASRRDWQLLSICIMTFLFFWASSAILVFLGALRTFAVPALVLIFVSLGGTACGIVLWDKMTAAFSAALVIGVPFVLLYPQSSYLILINMLVIWIFIGVLVEKRRFKKARYGR